MEHKTRNRRTDEQLAGIVATVLLALALAVGVALFSRYTSEQLYQESISQLTEISTQLFEKLEVQLNIQWGYLEKMDESLADRSEMSTEQLARFLRRRKEELSPAGKTLQFIAIDETDYYYTAQGRQGVWTGAAELVEDADRQSFLITDWLTNDNLMVFVRRLDHPLVVKGNTIRYFAVLRSMDDMAPFFRSSAFRNQNTTYVIDDNGVKMFMDSVVPELDFAGRNIFHALRTRAYPHMGSFDACLQEVQQNTFLCTDVQIGSRNFYLTIKSLDGYDWSMLIFVPASEVAVSTRRMTASLVRVFIIILVLVIVLFLISVLFVNRFRKNQELLAVKTRSEAQLAEANRKLEQTNEALEKAQEATKEALQVAENASKAKTDFLSSMSHDIRTPMNAIIGITTLMKNEPGLSETMQEYLAKLESSGRHLLELINNVLDMNRIESGQTILHTQSTNLAEQVTQLDGLIRPQVNQKHQTMTIVTTHLSHENVIADPTRLQQVLVNILSNAVKYTPEGGQILFELEELPRNEHYAKYKFIVRDTGIGMTREFIQHIFDPFTRAENSTTNKVQGTGLGMAITKSLVDLMGGVIHVDSTPGKGSRFEVLLEFPIDTQADQNVQHLSLLLIDCDEGDFARIRDAAAGKPIHLFRAENVPDALENLHHASYDVVLMRQGTPEADVHALREMAGANTILLSVSGPEEQQDSVPAGADGTISYPFFLSNLETEVRRVQEARTAPQQQEDVSPLCGMRFLCAEDNEINAEILRLLLESKGASCTICRNGQELVDAFATVQPGEYDMILMDVQMPVMDGLEAARRIRRSVNPLGRSIPILAMTANAFLEDIQKSREAGMNEHLSKPVDVGVLEQAVRRLRATPPRKIMW